MKEILPKYLWIIWNAWLSHFMYSPLYVSVFLPGGRVCGGCECVCACKCVYGLAWFRLGQVMGENGISQFYPQLAALSVYRKCRVPFLVIIAQIISLLVMLKTCVPPTWLRRKGNVLEFRTFPSSLLNPTMWTPKKKQVGKRKIKRLSNDCCKGSTELMTKRTHSIHKIKMERH